MDVPINEEMRVLFEEGSMLTLSRMQTLKAAIVAETAAEFVALREARTTAAMAAWPNGAVAPEQTAWLSAADRRTLDEAAG